MKVERLPIKGQTRGVYSPRLLLSFTTATPPTGVPYVDRYYKVRPFTVRPQQCGRCLRFGHGARNCKRPEVCPTCALHHAQNQKCTRPALCANCAGQHSATAKVCPIWQMEKTLIERAQESGVPTQLLRSTILREEISPGGPTFGATQNAGRRLRMGKPPPSQTNLPLDKGQLPPSTSVDLGKSPFTTKASKPSKVGSPASKSDLPPPSQTNLPLGKGQLPPST